MSHGLEHEAGKLVDLAYSGMDESHSIVAHYPHEAIVKAINANTVSQLLLATRIEQLMTVLDAGLYRR